MDTNQVAVIITGSGRIAATIEGQSYTIDKDHPKYNDALDAIRSKDYNRFVDLVNITKQVNSYLSTSGVSVVDGAVTYNGEVIHNTLTKRILDFMREGLPYEPLIKFFENLMENPSKRAVDELYDFLEAGELPITEEGHFLAYKNVRSNFMDIYSGTFRNMIGDVCEMPRNRVDEDKDRTCSYGLHFCSIKYLPHFADGDNGKTMVVKINPKDVIAIPTDYQNTKGRCCKYEVVSEYKEDWRSKLQNNESGWNSPLYSSNGQEYQWDDEDYEEDDDCSCDDDCGYCDSSDDNQNDYYGVKPSGHKYHNVRDNTGKFVKKNW
jgi:hypothetical protein